MCKKTHIEKKIKKAVDKILRNKVFNIAKNPKYDGCQHGLVSVVYKFFNKKTATLAKKSAIENEIISNKELAEELHEPIITNIDKREDTRLL